MLAVFHNFYIFQHKMLVNRMYFVIYFVKQLTYNYNIMVNDV